MYKRINKEKKRQAKVDGGRYFSNLTGELPNKVKILMNKHFSKVPI